MRLEKHKNQILEEFTKNFWDSMELGRRGEFQTFVAAAIESTAQETYEQLKEAIPTQLKLRTWNDIQWIVSLVDDREIRALLFAKWKDFTTK